MAKHHKRDFDRLLSLVKEDDNRESLRAHMETIRLPCIPYLGEYICLYTIRAPSQVARASKTLYDLVRLIFISLAIVDFDAIEQISA